MKAIPLLLVTLAACSGSSVGTTSEAATSCGAGTHEEMGTCVRDTMYQVRAAPLIGADGTTRVRVRAIGTLADGTFATDEVVLNTDRAGAGTYLTPALTLGPLGGTTYFTPCDQSVAGCLGPLELTVALASAPSTPVAHASVMLVDPLDVNPAKPCLGGGNVLHFEGDDTIYNGTLDVTAGTFQMTGFSDATTLTVTPSDPSQGTSWRLEFRTTLLDGIIENYAARYDDAELYGFEDRDHPGMLVDGNGHTCSMVAGWFQVQDDGSYPPSHATISFDQYCDGSTYQHGHARVGSQGVRQGRDLAYDGGSSSRSTPTAT